jgi:SulP family sulfate permease
VTQFGARTTRAISALGPSIADYRAFGRNPRGDIVAGLSVAVVALPLALAFGVASGMGARAGLVTAVIAGLIAAAFGGSNLQVSGPTGAMTVVLVPIVHEFGRSGALMVGAMAGVALVVMAFAKVGRYVRFLPTSLVEGFTAGIAAVIFLQQVPAALGVTDAHGDHVWASAADAIQQYSTDPALAPLLVAAGVATLMLVGARWRPGIPFSLIGVIVATFVAREWDHGLITLGTLPASLPRPSAGFIDLGAFSQLVPAALAIAALAALESLLCASVADGMSVGEQHDPDKELFGQGLANLVVPFFGGIPATAAIARTAVNVRAGARSRLAAIVHSVVLLVIVYLGASWVGDIPLAALAGVLFATTIHMVEVGSLIVLMRATRADAAIVSLTLVVTIAFDLITVVGVGLAVAAIMALRVVARSAHIDEVSLDLSDHSDEEHALLSEHIVAYRIDGPLFFAAAHRLLLELPDIADIRVVILRMSRVSTIDATGAHVLGDAISKLERRGIVVMLSGLKPADDRLLQGLGIADELRRGGLIFSDTPVAIAEARRILTSPDGGMNHLSGLFPVKVVNQPTSVPQRPPGTSTTKARLTQGVVRGDQARRLIARAHQRNVEGL